MFYLGATLPINDDPKLSIAVDLDGENGDYFSKTTKTLSFDVTELEYTIVLKDAFNDDLTYDTPDNGKFQLPFGAGPGFQYWVDENGKIRYGGSTFNVNSSMDADPKDGVITLTAFYAGISEHTIQYWISAAIEGADYDFDALYVIDGGDVVAVYSESEYGTDSMMNDFARYMGAIYRTSEGDIVSVYFNGNEYVWKEELGLAGSNWVQVDDSGNIVYTGNKANTLVRAVTDYFNGGVLYKNSIALELTNKAGDKAVLNYGLGIENSGSTVGYDKVRQLGDYSVEVLFENGDIHIVMKVASDKIDGYRNVLTTLEISYFDWMGDAQGGQYYYIDEPDNNGVVAEIVYEDVYNVDSYLRVSVGGYVAGTIYSFYSQDTDMSTVDDIGTETNIASSKTV